METPQSSTTSESEVTGEKTPNFNLRATFDLDAIQQLRSDQRTTYDQTVQGNVDAGFSVGLSEFYGKRMVGQTIANYLQEKGLSYDDPDFLKYRDSLSEVSILSVPESDWAATFKEGSTTEIGQSGRDKTRALYEQLSGKSYYGSDEFNEEDTEVLKNWHEELDKMRENLAVLSAKRQGRLAGKGGEEYEKALAEYNTHLIALGKLENDKIINDGEMPVETKKAKITQYLFDEQKKLRELTTEKLKNTKVGRFVDKFTTFMKRGSKGMRIAKTIGLGLGLAGVGAAAGALTGGIAGAAIIAGGLIGAARFARSFAMADARYGRGMEAEPDGVKSLEEIQGEEGEPDTYVDRLVAIFNKQYEADTKNEQNKRRKSVGFALGTLAVGVVAGEAGHLIANGIADSAAQHASEAAQAAKAAAAAKAQAAAEHAQHIAEEAAAKAKAAAEAAQAAANAAANHLDPAYVVDPGEGGIQLFEHAGLTEANWYQIQNDLMAHFGPGNGDVFYQNPGEAVRIDHPGQLPLDVQQYIKNYFGK